MPRLFLHLLFYLAFSTTATAATYFVDFESGDNSANGLSPQEAWKQSPGDRRATGAPANIELQPGDKLIFKGGVRYKGEILLRDVKGAEGEPIVLDGNTEDIFGEGRAILDGAKIITNWQPVASADMVKSNPLWRQILFADVDMDLTSNFAQDRFILHREGNADSQAPWQRMFLVDGEKQVLPIAQNPKPLDPFFPDLPRDFHISEIGLASTYPHQVYYPKGSKGDPRLPLIAITYGGNAPVIEPLHRGEVAVDLASPTRISEFAFKLKKPASTPPPEQVAFIADGNEIHLADVDPADEKLQRFVLAQSVEAKTIIFQLRHKSTDSKWTKLQQVAAFTPEGVNILEHQVLSVIEDPQRLAQQDPSWYADGYVGVHGGNNHVYFAKVRRYDPETSRLMVPHFPTKTYKKTRYALYNSPRFIALPGEWSIEPLPGRNTRVFFLPEKTKLGIPKDIGYPMLQTAISIDGASKHIEVRGFLIQRYAGGKGGVAVNGVAANRPSHIRIVGCEVRFISGQSGISLNHSDHLTIKNCYVHHCPGWTVGIYVNRIKDFRLISNRVDYNSGSGIRHYEAKNGTLKNNVVLNHYGMHASGLNFYVGCRNILYEDNYTENVVTINRSAENLIFRNNVIDSKQKNAVALAMWRSGQVGGRHMKNLIFEKNTFININSQSNWGTAIFVQDGASPPEGLVVRNNVLSRLRKPFDGIVEENIYMFETPADIAGSDSLLVEDISVLFRDPVGGDFRRRPGGPMMHAGADLPPPKKQWTP